MLNIFDDLKLEEVGMNDLISVMAQTEKSTKVFTFVNC